MSDAAYWRFMGNAGELLGIEGQELAEAVKGVARRRFRRRLPGFAKERKGAKGFSKDLDRVMRSHFAETVRYVVLDQFKFDAINMMEKEGLSPNRSSNQANPWLQRAFDMWYKDVNGQKQILEGAVDQILERPWATPLKTAMTTGAIAGGATFAWTGGAVISPLVGGYVAYRVGLGMARGGTFVSRGITGGMLGDMAHAKLGMIFNLASATFNISQLVLNTYPVVGEKHFGVGMKRFYKAARSKMQGKPNSDWRLLQRMDVHPLNTLAEGTRSQFMKEGKLSRASLFAFTTTETLNRGVTALAAINKAQSEGKNSREQLEYANEVMDRTQFHYGTADKNALLRNVFAASTSAI